MLQLEPFKLLEAGLFHQFPSRPIPLRPLSIMLAMIDVIVIAPAQEDALVTVMVLEITS